MKTKKYVMILVMVLIVTISSGCSGGSEYVEASKYDKELCSE